MQNKVLWSIIAIMAIVIVFLKSCGGKQSCPTPVTIIVKDTVYLHDSTETTVYVPQPIKQIASGHIEFIDSAAIVADYLSSRVYSDSVQSKYGLVVINDTVSRNSIADRRVIFDFKIPEINTTITKTVPPKNQVWIGIEGGVNLSGAFIGSQLTLKTKGENMYHLGADYTTSGKFIFRIGKDWKIHL